MNAAGGRAVLRHCCKQQGNSSISVFSGGLLVVVAFGQDYVRHRRDRRLCVERANTDRGAQTERNEQIVARLSYLYFCHSNHYRFTHLSLRFIPQPAKLAGLIYETMRSWPHASDVIVCT